MLDDALTSQANSVLTACRSRGVMLATAESCTGGLIAAVLTSVAGSSDVVDRGFITYSNAAKSELLGVDPDLITRHGAVSEPVAAAMARGCLARSNAQIAVSVTGIAGPGGGTESKPVGLVHFGFASRGIDGLPNAFQLHHVFAGQDRDGVRRLTVLRVFDTLIERLT